MRPTSATLKVTQDEKSMKVERTTTAMGMTRSGTAIYALDGSPSKNTVNAHGHERRFRSTVEWDGDVLVIKTTALILAAARSQGTERYSLSDDKKTLVIASDASIGGQSVTGKQTFVRAIAPPSARRVPPHRFAHGAVERLGVEGLLDEGDLGAADDAAFQLAHVAGNDGHRHVGILIPNLVGPNRCRSFPAW